MYRVTRMVMALVALTLSFAAAQHDHSAANEATYTFDGEALEGPESLPAGYHLVTLQNDGESSVDIIVVRLLDGATTEDIVAHFQAIDEAFMGGDPVEAINEALTVAELYGGPDTEGGERGSVGITLPEGRYAVVASYRANGEEQADDAMIEEDTGDEDTGDEGEDEASEDMGPPPPSSYATIDLEVTSDDAAEAPEADVTVQMVEFAFAFPAAMPVGEQLWEVVNSGEQLHHLVLVRIREGFTMDDVMAYAESFEGEDPTEQVGHVNILSPGISNFASFDLTPGTYLATCFLPDHGEDGDGRPHFLHGMMQTFTVDGD
ncbi:MAG: hypothetical protein M3498_18420 [Deinococcota bacterium]|nr:hypothetical protein [Deinococcota bacterium]